MHLFIVLIHPYSTDCQFLLWYDFFFIWEENTIKPIEYVYIYLFKQRATSNLFCFYFALSWLDGAFKTIFYYNNRAYGALNFYTDIYFSDNTIFKVHMI